jgi:glycosyltransferase involved in cell wall biosynthesis
VTCSVSVILPVFNAEATLPETLSSIAAEFVSHPEIQWQVIAVDDGSTDDSLKILEQWSFKLPMTIASLSHTGSPAGPRNHGIETATSDYVFFLDADDVLIPGGLSSAVSCALENDSDVVLVKLKSLDGRGVPRGMFGENMPRVTLSNSRIYWALNPMKLVKLSLLVGNQIRFATDLHIGEDQPFSAKCYLNAKIISILSDPPTVGVRYTRSGSNLTLRVKPTSAYLALLEQMAEIIDSSNLDLEAKRVLWIRHWEIEIARELIWNSMPITPGSHRKDFGQLHLLNRRYLVPQMLPRTSIRWRGIVGLIGTSNYAEFEKLLSARKRVLENQSFAGKIRGVVVSNWIRVKATVRLPKSF